MPGHQNDSWWDRVGRPESTETTDKTHKLGKLQKKWKITTDRLTITNDYFPLFL